MPTTYPEAYDTITEHFTTQWELGMADVLGPNPTPAPELRFSGIEVGEIPATYFARFHMQPVYERQATFRNGDTGSQRYTSGGLLHVQVFAPRTDERGAEFLRVMAQVAKLAFRGQSLDGCIWFREVRINDLDPEQAFWRKTVLAEYEYDEQG